MCIIQDSSFLTLRKDLDNLGYKLDLDNLGYKLCMLVNITN